MDTGTIEQTVTAAEGGTAVSFGQIGQISGGLQIGQISNYRVVGESHFYELNLDKIAGEGTDDPPRAEELTDILAEHRLLILAGEMEDKSECARHIAYRLYRRLTRQGSCVVLRERCRGKDPQRIETAFHEEHTTILLLTEISQSLIAGYGPAKLRRLLLERGGYAIVTTDCTRAQWEIADGTVEARLWQELSWETYYGHGRLTSYLEQLLFNSPLEIPEGLVSEEPDGAPRVGGVLLVRAVETLKTPERIRTFVNSLVEGQAPPTPEGVETKLAELAGDAAAIRQWYLQFNDRDQLLVVGLVLLDGLPDDLLFAGLEILVETIWRETDPLFSQFDYRDLSRFAAYFKQTPIDGGFLRIECGSRKRRVDILQVAWNHQRRRLLATLPALTEMVRVSASESAAPTPGERPSERDEPATVSPARAAAERALSRTKSGSMQLHQVVVESLSLIGLMSIEVVEPYLLDLAAEPLESVQLLVARALAAWREANKEGEFFSLLRRWWSEACDVGNSESRIARAGGLSPDPWAAVRATLAITVSYAAQYDRENRLALELFGLLQVLVDDPHPRVREAVWKHALPRTVAWHLSHLDPFLRQRVLVSADFVQAVARGAAEACEMRPGECLPVVEAWWTAARADQRHGTRSTVLSRESLLATVAETFGYIRCPEGHTWMSPEELVGKLRSILTEEGHPFIRRHALQAVETQTQTDIELATQLLPDLLTRLTFEDRPRITALAVRSYLHERQHLEGGDTKLELDGRSYSVWINRARPLTNIETTLYSWLLDHSRPVAQQLAVASFGAFAATTLDREERRLLLARPRTTALGEGSGSLATSAPQVYRLNPFGHLAVVAATLGREEVRPLLRPLMAEVIVERHRQLVLLAGKLREAKLLGKRKGVFTSFQEETALKRSALDAEKIEVILERWGRVRNRSAQTLAGYLQKAVLFYRWRWGMVAVLGILLFGLIRLYQRAEQALMEPLEMLADQVIPTPDVREDFMAPLLPGKWAAEPIRFPYVVELVRTQPDPTAENTSDSPVRYPGNIRSVSDRLANLDTLPKPCTLGHLAAPLPAGRSESWSIQRHHDTNAMDSMIPGERARNWRKKILLMD